MSLNLTWHRMVERPGKWLQFKVPDEHISVRELDEHIAAIVLWCEATKCGRRMAYNMWQFKTDRDMTAFALRWT